MNPNLSLPLIVASGALLLLGSCKGSGASADSIDTSLPVDSQATLLTSGAATPVTAAVAITDWLVGSDSIDASYARRLTRAVIDRYNAQGRPGAVDSLRQAVDSLGNRLSPAEQQRLVEAFSSSR